MPCDAIVIGGGPAAAAVLAAKGRRVVVLEKEKFPRCRIGVLRRIGASHFTRKHRVRFAGSRGRASVPFYFSQRLFHREVGKNAWIEKRLAVGRQFRPYRVPGASRFAAYGARVCEAVEAMRKLASNNQAFSSRAFIDGFPRREGHMTDCLMGNASRGFHPLFNAVSRFAGAPAPLPHGRPVCC